MKVAVLGLGNLLLGDEGFGVHAVRYLEGRLPPDVELIDGGTKGLYLYPFLEDVTHLIVIDVVRVDGEPGKVITFKREELHAGIHVKMSAHDIALPDLLALLELKGGNLRDLRLIGVIPEPFVAAVQLSPALEKALPTVEERVKEILREWGLTYRGRPLNPPNP